jgi:hypothetical protein
MCTCGLIGELSKSDVLKIKKLIVSTSLVFMGVCRSLALKEVSFDDSMEELDFDDSESYKLGKE